MMCLSTGLQYGGGLGLTVSSFRCNCWFKVSLQEMNMNQCTVSLNDGGMFVLYHLSDHLQDLVFSLRWSQHPECLQTPKTPQDLPLLLLQSEVAVGDQRLVPLYLLRCSSVLPSSLLNQPIVTCFLLKQKRRRNGKKVFVFVGTFCFLFFPQLKIHSVPVH